MNKVYIVTSGDYSDYHIDAVFSTKQGAEKYCALKNTCDRYSDFYNIEEYDIDDMNASNTKVVYAFLIEPSNPPTVEATYYISEDRANAFKEKALRWQKSGDILQDYYSIDRYVFLAEENPDKAIKIVLDRVAKAKAEKEGVC